MKATTVPLRPRWNPRRATSRARLDAIARFVARSSLALALVLLPLSAHAQTAPRLLKGPYLQNVAPSSVEIRAELDSPVTATVTLTPQGADAGTVSRTASDAAGTMHVVRVEHLEPSTRYAYVFTAGSVTARGELTTAPLPSSVAPFSFLVYGDDRTDDVAHAAIVRAMTQSPSDFLINTGDYVENGSVPEQWQTFFDIERPLLGDRCVFGCVGNHELIDGAGANYLRYFGPRFDARGDGPTPKLYGSLRWGSARIFLFDAMESFEVGGSERAWLDDELSRTDAERDVKWRIVVLHHSPWSAGPHGGNKRMLSVGIPALLAQHHIDLILAGHDHIYERGFASGIGYVITGGGGAPLYPVDHPIPSTRKVESVHHFVEAVVSADAIRIVARRDDGSVVDRCGLLKTTGEWDCDPRPATAPGASPSSGTPAASAASKCACAAVGRRSSGSPAPIVGLALAMLAVSRRRHRCNRG